ncbi:hypothetical protein BN871_EU_00280 [Paenibacillus sp. P22]|nr:hypothetical protein BN871_EU_00280 [Paenibacillus sp. P22]
MKKSEPPTIADGWRLALCFFLRKDIACCAEDGVPFLARESDVGGLDAVLQTLDVHRADDRLHAGRMAQNPGDGDRRVADAVLRRDLVDLLVQLGELVAAEEDAFEESVLERRPRLDRDVMQTAEVEDAAVAVHGRSVLHVDVEALGDHRGVRDAQLQLVGYDRLLYIFLQQLDLHRILVGDAEVADLAGALQQVERLCDLFRLDERIRTVEQQRVQVIGLQALQDGVDGIQDMLLGEVEHAGTDAAFGLQDEVLAHARRHMDGFREDFLAVASAVNVRMLEEIGAELKRRLDEALSLGLVQRVDAHAADGDDGNFKTACSEWNRSHRYKPPKWMYVRIRASQKLRYASIVAHAESAFNTCSRIRTRARWMRRKASAGFANKAAMKRP